MRPGGGVSERSSETLMGWNSPIGKLILEGEEVGDDENSNGII